MEELKKENQQEQDLEIVDIEPVVKEFVHTPQRRKAKRKNVDYSGLILPGGFLLAAVIVIICGIFLCKASAVTVILVVLLETLLALCLCRTPIWLHGLVIILNIILGIVFHLAVFMILASVLYLAGILVLHSYDASK